MERYKQELGMLNEAQREAVEAVEGPVLVVAGPGTGKTQLLSTRAAYILRNTQVETKNILCLTFTENAAFNMKQRMVGIIGEAAYKITTSTYHSFGSELLKRFPQYFPDVATAKPIDQLLQYSIIEQIIDSLEYENPLKKSKYYIKDVLSTINELKSNLIKPERLEALAKENSQFADEINQYILEHLGEIPRMNKKYLPNFEKLLAESKSLKTDKKEKTKLKPLSELFISELSEALENVVDNNTKSLTAWKNDWLDKNGDGKFILSGDITNQKLLAMADIYQRYLDELENKKYYDFADMILFAIEGLENNPDFRYTLQEQYQYIMLDEFQDTNQSQMKLVELLTDNPVYERKPNIMAVGDDNQAIYAFQGADYSNIEKFKSLYDDIKVIELEENYRSHQDILKSADTISGQIETKLERNSAGLIAKSDIDSSVIERHEFKSDVAQFAWVANQITSLINSGLKPSEIAVIAPKHALIEPLMPYLRKGKVPVYYEKRENILDDIFINQIIKTSELVNALANHDEAVIDSLWAEVLSYEYWGIDTEELWQLSESAHKKRTGWTKLIAENKNLKPIYQFFIKLASIASSESLETMLDYLTGIAELKVSKDQSYASPFHDYYFGNTTSKTDQSNFWNLLSNLTVLRQKIRDRQTNHIGVLKLKDFIDFVEMHKSAEIKILNTSPYNEQQDSVQLMTAYAAKGLEFNTVFMLASIDEAWGPKTSEKSNNIPLAKNLKHIRYDGASDDERLRLLYVAMTRAKQRLFMTSYQSNYANKPTNRIRFFEEAEKDNKITSLVLPSPDQEVINQDHQAPKLDDLQPYWADRHLVAAKNAKLSALLKPKLDQYQLAPTHLNSFTDLINAGPEAFFLNTILRFPSSSTPSSIFGSAIHDVIEWLHIQQVKTGKLPSAPSAINEFNRLLLNKPLGDNDHKLLKRRGARVIKNYHEASFREFGVNDEHEFDFSGQGVVVGDAKITGKIDKMIIDKKSREITVVDFKTGQAITKWNNSDPKLHKYKQQLYFYKLLVEGSYQFEGYRVTSAYLDFVEADEQSERKLYLQFDKEEQTELIKLIKSVWKHIQELDFPDVSEYQDTMAGIKKFEDHLTRK